MKQFLVWKIILQIFLWFIYNILILLDTFTEMINSISNESFQWKLACNRHNRSWQRFNYRSKSWSTITKRKNNLVYFNFKQTNQYFENNIPSTVDLLPTMATFLQIPLTGNVSLIQSEIHLQNQILTIKWRALDNQRWIHFHWVSTIIFYLFEIFLYRIDQIT